MFAPPCNIIPQPHCVDASGVERVMDLLTDLLLSAKAWELHQLPCWMQWLLHIWWSTDCHLLSCFSCCDYISYTGTFPFGIQVERRFFHIKAPSGWVTLLQFLPPKLWGNLQEANVLQPFLIMLLFLRSLSSTTSLHVPNVRQMCHSAACLVFLKWLAQQMFL